MPLRGAAGSIREAIEDSRVVDAHAHLRAIADLRPMTFTKLLDDSFVHLSLRVADGSPNALGTRLEIPLEHDSWKTAQVVAQKVEANSFYRWLLAGIGELHELEVRDLDRATWQQLTTAIARRYDQDDWLSVALDHSHIETVIWDPFWLPGQTETPEPRIRPSLRVSSAMAAFHPDASDYEGTNLVRDWSRQLDVDVTTLDDLEELLQAVLEANLTAGAGALKVPIAYERTLTVAPATRHEAARIFGRKPQSVSSAERLVFGDYILRFLLDRAREHGLVVQVHLGLARLEYSHPLAIVPLLREFPELVFDLFHGGYPWIREVAALAHSYPNVRLNLVWLPLISTEAAADALREWIQVVPQVDRICWGSDARTPEEACGALLAGKYAIALAIGKLIDDRYLSFTSGLRSAESILSGAARAIYRTTESASGQGTSATRE
jgi:predicted TIM-barrel fold metal-dependent hydrolase